MDSINEDCWLNFESPMFTLVDPNEICPIGILTETTQAQINNDNAASIITTANNQNAGNYYIYDNAIPVESNVQIPIIEQDQQFQRQKMQDDIIQQQVIIQQPTKQSEHIYRPRIQTQDENKQCNMPIEPPPMLSSFDEPGFEIQKQLRLHRVLSRQRQEKLRARLERQPPDLPSLLTRKGSGRKMTGRERQLELERQEANQLELRNRYLNLINELEQKCTRLREILENIVATSPEYNNQMINFLESSNLLFDQNEVSSRNVERHNSTSIAAHQSRL